MLEDLMTHSEESTVKEGCSCESCTVPDDYDGNRDYVRSARTTGLRERLVTRNIGICAWSNGHLFCVVMLRFKMHSSKWRRIE